MAQSTFGQISEYQPDVEPFETYEQRVHVFLRANKIDDDEELTFAAAVEMATTAETVEEGLNNLSVSSRPDIHKVLPKKSSSCYRCGKDGHWANDCKHRVTVCRRCGKRGHLQAVCRSSKPFQKSSSTFPVKNIMNQGVGEEKDDSSGEEDLGIFQVNSTRGSPPPILVSARLNGCSITMEVDTGAAVSIVSEKVYQRYLKKMSPLQVTELELQTYTKEPIEVLGKCDVLVEYESQSVRGSVYVVAGKAPCLMGRDLLQLIRLNWARIHQVKTANTGVQKVLSKYSKVFKAKLGTFRHHQATLRLKHGAAPRFFRPRAIPFALKEAVEEELQKLEQQGILESVVSSDWAAPIVVVPKKDGSIRICGDYKVTLNPVLDIDVYPLPKPQELFASLAGGQKFTKLDLSQAYQQLQLDPKSREMVTINTHKGLYRYNRLPFGVASAPAVFQRTMDDILRGIPQVLCYLDDILITGRNDAEHLCNLEEVLHRLMVNGVTVRREKCYFLRESVEYLGHVIDAHGLHTAPNKLKAIVDAPQPLNIKELRSFLGLLNYYGSFIPHLSSLLHPLHKLLKQDVTWEWTEQCAQAFAEAKASLASNNVLIHFDPALPISLATDASAYGLGAVVSHTMPDGRERPVAFASRTMTATEKNYSQLEKEALAIVFGVKKFHQYLYGRQFSLLTDHKPLTTILGPKTGIPTLAAARLQRWAICLSAYSFVIGYRGTGDHSNADGLSRLPLSDVNTSDVPDVASMFNVVQMSALPLTHKQLRSASRCDPVVSKVLMFVQCGWPQCTPQEELRDYWRRRQQLTVEAGCLLWGMRVVVPTVYRKKVLEMLHEGHPGIVKMKCLARSYVWWPGLDQDIENVARSCAPCIQIKSNPGPVPLHPWVWPRSPWKRIHVDFAGPLFDKSYLVVVDAHSKWPEVWEMSSTSSSKTIEVLKHLFSMYGLPEQLVSDNGPQFRSDEFYQFMKNCGIKHYRSATYHPATNGAVERFVQTLKQALKTGRLAGKPTKEVLFQFLMSYRSSDHAVTGVPPSQLFLARQIRTKLDLLRPSQQDVVETQQAKQKRYHDKGKKQKYFQVGDRVAVRIYRHDLLRWKNGEVAQILGSRLLLVKLEDGSMVKKHVDQVQHRIVTSEEVTDDLLQDLDFQLPAAQQEEEPPLAVTSTVDGGVGNSTNAPVVPQRRYPLRDRRPPDRPGFIPF